MHEIPEIIRVASPVYLKFGLRNAPDIYPAGSHLVPTAVAPSRERVRRARLGLGLLARSVHGLPNVEARRTWSGRASLQPTSVSLTAHYLRLCSQPKIR